MNASMIDRPRGDSDPALEEMRNILAAVPVSGICPVCLVGQVTSARRTLQGGYDVRCRKCIGLAEPVRSEACKQSLAIAKARLLRTEVGRVG
jgi:hypothetical protein